MRGTERTAASVIIPSYRGRSHLETCLPEVLDQAGQEVEVLVVDNGSDDGTTELVRDRFGAVRLVTLPENRGFTGAVAGGVEAARGEVLVLLNNDTLPEAGWLASLIGALRDAPPEVGTVTGRIVSWEGERLDFWRGALTFDGHAFQLDFGRPLAEVETAGRRASLPFPCGGNMAVRRECWEEVGGFDPVFFAYLEDVDFGWRAWARGWSHRYEPAATVRHRSAATSSGLGLFRRGYLFERNAFLTAFKNLDEEQFSRLMPAILWTLLHRTWSLMERNNADGWRLSQVPFPPRPAAPRPAAPVAADGLLARVRRHGVRGSAQRLLVRAARALSRDGDDALFLHDPRTIEQLRAVRFLLGHLDRAAEERERIQRLRIRSDAEYFGQFPLLLVPTYPGDPELFSSDGFRRLLPHSPELVRRTLEQIGRL